MIAKHPLNYRPDEWERLRVADGLLDQYMRHFDDESETRPLSIKRYDLDQAFEYRASSYYDRPGTPKKFYDIDSWLASLKDKGIFGHLVLERNGEGYYEFYRINKNK